MADDKVQVKISASAEEFNQGMQAAISQLTSSIGQMNSMFSQMSSSISSSMSRAAEESSSATNKMKSSLDSVPSSVNNIGSAFSGLRSHLTSLVSGFIGFGAVVTAVKEGLSFDSNIQQATISFQTLLGSAEEAEKMISSLKKFAADTPFEFPDLQNAAKRMLAFGFSAKDILPTLKSVGDAASGLGMSGKEGVERIILALGQMRAKTKVSGDEMLQLTEAGIPAWDILAQSMGKSTAEVMKLSEKGVIPADKAIQALVQGMEERFPNMMQKQSTTFQGLMSTIKDNAQFIIGDIVQPLFDKLAQEVLPRVTQGIENFQAAMKTGGLAAGFKTMFSPALVDGFVVAMRSATTVVRGVAQAVEELRPLLFGIAVGYVAVKTAALGSAIATGLQTIAFSLQTGAVALAAEGTWAFNAANIAAQIAAVATTLATEGLTAAFRALAVAMNINPIILAISLAIAALAVIVYEVITHWEAFKNFCISMWNSLVNFISDHIGTILALFPGLGAAIYVVYSNWDNIIGFLKSLWKGLCDTVNWVIEGIKSLLAAAEKKWNEFAEAVSKGIEKAKEILSNFVSSFIPSWGNNLFSKITSLGNSLAEKTANIGDTMRKNLTINLEPANTPGHSMADFRRMQDTNNAPVDPRYTSSSIAGGPSGVDWSGVGDSNKKSKDKKGGQEETEYQRKKKEYETAVAKAKYETEAVEGKKWTDNDDLYLYEYYLKDVTKLDNAHHQETLDFQKGEYERKKKMNDDEIALTEAKLDRELALTKIAEADKEKIEKTINDKIAAGKPLTADEQKIYNDFLKINNALAGSVDQMKLRTKTIEDETTLNKKYKDQLKEQLDLIKGMASVRQSMKDIDMKNAVTNRQMTERQLHDYKKNEAKTTYDNEQDETVKQIKHDTADPEKFETQIKLYQKFLASTDEMEQQSLLSEMQANAKKGVDITKTAEKGIASWKKYSEAVKGFGQEDYQYTNRYVKLAFDSMESSMAKGLDGILQRTTSFSQAMKNIFNSMVKSLSQQWTSELAKKWTDSLSQMYKQLTTHKAKV
ncbi:MAG: tape measure domain protein, partial [Firmicutes bacterium]|nr:tape measure domain protein [Bacillota bacterium]